jgi:hypothetical protein
MKNLKPIILILVTIFIYSCSKDDDVQPQVNKEYFPTKITTTFATSPISNVTTLIKYDEKNRIVELKYEKADKTDTYEVIYDTNNLIALIKLKKVSSGITTTKTHLFSYLNSYLQKFEEISSTGIQSYNVQFNIATNTYTFEGYASEAIKIDEFGNIIEYNFRNGVKSDLTYNNNKGVFTNTNSLALILANFTNANSDFNSVFFSALLFSNKEITTAKASVYSGSINYDLVTTRASNNTISNIDHVRSTTGIIYSTSNIEYELRPVN